MIEKNCKRFQRTAIDWKQNLLNLELNDKDNFFKPRKKNNTKMRSSEGYACLNA